MHKTIQYKAQWIRCGGKFEHGFLSGFVSSLSGSFIQAYGGDMGLETKIALNAAIGGTAEALGGGKFANGAITGAYVGLFNHAMHEWIPTVTEAGKVASETTTTTGNETSVLVYQDDSGNDYYWVCPHDSRNSPICSFWVEPPTAETSDLTLVREFHYSVKHGPPDKNGTPTILRGSYQDWQNARDFNIRVTHHTIGVGSWNFEPTLFFTQPPAILYPEYIHWNKKYPIPSPKWYKPRQ